MGYEIDCHGKFGDRESEGKALLETDSLIFRGRNLRFEIAFAEITALEARKGHLVITTNRG
ncbi:MAG TPA: hypothetical protein VMT00_09295 [Thermoanaerobaculia bacterium]|nr:hypothetical protein [Thermoanaerobaculia bacterium]